MFEPIKASKDPRTMSNREWKAELERISRVSYARRHFATDQAETQRALEKYGAQPPRQNGRLHQIDAKIAELQKQQDDPTAARKLAALQEIRKEIA
jgi:hypothetical protein